MLIVAPSSRPVPLADCKTPLEFVEFDGWWIGFKLENSHKIRAAKFVVEWLLQQGQVTRTKEAVAKKVAMSSSCNAADGVAMHLSGTNAELHVFTDVLTGLPMREKIDRWPQVRLHVIDEPDATGSHAKARQRAVRAFLRENPDGLEINQYSDSLWPCGYAALYREIEQQLDLTPLSAVFVPVGTGALLRAAVQYKLRHGRSWRIYAVDAAGSGLNGAPEGKRLFPGYGNGAPTEWTRQALPHVDDWLRIPDKEVVRASRWLMARGQCRGASSCAAFAAAARIGADGGLPHYGATVVISPDGGELYGSTLYSQQWLQRNKLI